MSGPKFVIVRARAPKGVASFEETAVDLCTLDRGQASARLQLLGRLRERSGKLWLSLTRLSHPSVTESPVLRRMEGSRAMIWKAVVASHCAPRSIRRRWNRERRPSSVRRWTMSANFETRFVSTEGRFLRRWPLMCVREGGVWASSVASDEAPPCLLNRPSVEEKERETRADDGGSLQVGLWLVVVVPCVPCPDRHVGAGNALNREFRMRTRSQKIRPKVVRNFNYPPFPQMHSQNLNTDSDVRRGHYSRQLEGSFKYPSRPSRPYGKFSGFMWFDDSALTTEPILV